jgi:hypothetical protein
MTHYVQRNMYDNSGIFGDSMLDSLKILYQKFMCTMKFITQ